MKGTPPWHTNPSGVIDLKQDLLWQLFLDTGDPMCWVIYRHMEPR